MSDTVLFALLHVLVFVYWLGGDLGAFYASHYLSRPGVPVSQRLLAAKIVGDVDMAPRTALILALPTGLLLALSRGWLDWPMVIGWSVLGASLSWLALVWWLHLQHGKAPTILKQLDLLIRWLLAAGLVGVGIASLLGQLDVPAFLTVKCLLLAGAILTGLLIRGALTPLGPALAGLSDPDPGAAETSLRNTLNRVRPMVMVIWALLLSAALLGLWTPV